MFCPVIFSPSPSKKAITLIVSFSSMSFDEAAFDSFTSTLKSLPFTCFPEQEVMKMPITANSIIFMFFSVFNGSKSLWFLRRTTRFGFRFVYTSLLRPCHTPRNQHCCRSPENKISSCAGRSSSCPHLFLLLSYKAITNSSSSWDGCTAAKGNPRPCPHIQNSSL